MTYTALALLSACRWLQARPMLQCHPATLLDVTRHLVQVCHPTTPDECRRVGEAAVRECAMPLQSVVIKHVFNGEVLNPEDLQD